MCAKEKNTEQLILEAAEAEFLEKGYGKARTTEIAKRAGLTHAMLHYYFRTKEQLFQVIFQKKARVMAEMLLFSFKRDLPFLEKVKRGIEDHFDYIAANDKLPNFIFSEILYDEKLRDIFREIIRERVLLVMIMREVKAELENEAAKGTIRYMEPYDLLFTIVSLNVFAFLSAPAISGIIAFEEGQFADFLEHRKQLNVEIILNQLKI